jgi:hypothetical protein
LAYGRIGKSLSRGKEDKTEMTARLEATRSQLRNALTVSFAFENAFKIAFSMQNPNDMERIVIEKIENPDNLKTCNRPRA